MSWKATLLIIYNHFVLQQQLQHKIRMLKKNKSIQKPKKFILKTLQNLRNFLFGGHENIQTSHQPDHMYTIPDHHHDNADRPIKQQPLDTAVPSIEGDDDKKMKSGTCKRKVEPTSPDYSSSSFSRSYMLAHKMNELEMMDMSDVDQSLDVEEALHYYSRLTSPVYVDIVNKFFMDMYTEYLLPQPPITNVSSSSRRLGPLAL